MVLRHRMTGSLGNKNTIFILYKLLNLTAGSIFMIPLNKGLAGLGCPLLVFVRNTVNSEIFARNLFSRMALKDIFATLKFRDKGMIYPDQSTAKWSCHFTRVLFSRNFAYKTLAYAKFRENKTLAKISEFTVTVLLTHLVPNCECVFHDASILCDSSFQCFL